MKRTMLRAFFELFQNSVLKAYPTGKIAMVLNNGRIHKVASIGRFVEE